MRNYGFTDVYRFIYDGSDVASNLLCEVINTYVRHNKIGKRLARPLHDSHEPITPIEAVRRVAQPT